MNQKQSITLAPVLGLCTELETVRNYEGIFTCDKQR
jgi:hypothetical protein